MKQIQIKVSGSMSLFLGDKFVYRYTVNVPVGVDFPFSQVLFTLHTLYGANCVIQFLEV